MKQPATRELFSYWNRLRGDRLAPERSEIDPAGIRRILADTFMLDVDPGQRFPFRLAGTRVNGLFAAEQKGRSFLSLWRPEERRNIAAILMTVLDGTTPVVAGCAAAPCHQEECAFELLLLPMRQGGRTHSRVLGLLVNADKPAWLGLLPTGPLSLRSLRIVDEMPDAPQATAIRFGAGAPNEEERDDAPAFIPVPARRGRPALRLIPGGLQV